jgi:hypothetical protein
METRGPEFVLRLPRLASPNDDEKDAASTLPRELDADSHIVGAQLVGYMTAEVYVAPGVSRDLLRAMLDAHHEEVGRQAE